MMRICSFTANGLVGSYGKSWVGLERVAASDGCIGAHQMLVESVAQHKVTKRNELGLNGKALAHLIVCR